MKRPKRRYYGVWRERSKLPYEFTAVGFDQYSNVSWFGEEPFLNYWHAYAYAAKLNEMDPGEARIIEHNFISRTTAWRRIKKQLQAKADEEAQDQPKVQDMVA